MLRLTSDLHQENGGQVIDLEAEALRQLGEMIGGDFAAAVDEMLACKQRIVVSGMGKYRRRISALPTLSRSRNRPALPARSASAAPYLGRTVA